jgi:hypothetical protein
MSASAALLIAAVVIAAVEFFIAAHNAPEMPGQD